MSWLLLRRTLSDHPSRDARPGPPGLRARRLPLSFRKLPFALQKGPNEAQGCMASRNVISKRTGFKVRSVVPRHCHSSIANNCLPCDASKCSTMSAAPGPQIHRRQELFNAFFPRNHQVDLSALNLVVTTLSRRLRSTAAGWRDQTQTRSDGNEIH